MLRPPAEVVYLPGAKISAEDVADADALLVRTRTKCDAALLRGSKVRFIASATIGYDHIDTAYCEANGIFWTNAPGCNSGSVMQYVASAILNLAVKLDFALSDMAIGIVGVGNVGSKVANFAEACGMKVLLNDPPRARKEGKGKFVELRQIMEQADIITFHVPLNDEGPDKTFHLADENFFREIRRRIIFINSSRGEVVETDALKSAIKSGRLSATVIDVWENEPAIDRELLSLATFATPHIAGYSTDGKANGTAMSVQALSRHFGLNLYQWRPANIPPPEKPVVSFDCSGLTKEDILYKAVSATYDISDDDARLRKSPENFEKQRGDYPLRREFHAFSCRRLEYCPGPVGEIIEKIGFRGTKTHDLATDVDISD